MPQLLIAYLGPQFKDLLVCLQPHVYVVYPQNETHTTYQKAARSSDNTTLGRHGHASRQWGGDKTMEDAYEDAEG